MTLNRKCIEISQKIHAVNSVEISHCTSKPLSHDTTPAKCRLSLRRKSTFGLAMTFTFDLWPWNFLQ